MAAEAPTIPREYRAARPAHPMRVGEDEISVVYRALPIFAEHKRERVHPLTGETHVVDIDEKAINQIADELNALGRTGHNRPVHIEHRDKEVGGTIGPRLGYAANYAVKHYSLGGKKTAVLLADILISNRKVPTGTGVMTADQAFRDLPFRSIELTKEHGRYSVTGVSASESA